MQPFDAPTPDRRSRASLEQIGSDEMLLFSTDYPHWHFDGDDAVPDGISDALHAEDPASTTRLPPIPRLRREPEEEPMNVTVLDRAPDREARRVRRRASSASSIATCIPTCKSGRRSRPVPVGALARAPRDDRRTRCGRGWRTRRSIPACRPAPGCGADAWPPGGGHPGSDLRLHAGAAARPVRRRPTACCRRWSAALRRAQRRVRRGALHRRQRLAGAGLVATRSRG